VASACGDERVRTAACARIAASLGLALAVFLTLSGTASALPGAGLAPIRGMAYQPAPSDYKGDGSGVYFDSDFFNDDFEQLWGTTNGGRGDLQVMATQLNVNFLHLYNWNPARKHLAFMNEALKYGIRIAVPISNFFVGTDPNAEANIETIVRQIYVDTNGNSTTVPHPAVVMWTIANEYDLMPITAAKVAEATAHLVGAEQKIGAAKLLPVSVPVSFAVFPPSPDPGVSKTIEAINALKANPALGDAFVSSRFVAATNPQNEGTFIEQWLPKFKQQVPNMMLWFSELGTAVQNSCNGFPQPCTPSEDQQALFNAGEWKASQPGAEGILLGGAQFEWMNEDWKTGTEATFGIYKFATPNNYREVTGTGGTYRVDQLERKPSWFALQTAFGGSGGVGVGAVPGALGVLGAAAIGGVSPGLCDLLVGACAAAVDDDEPPPPVAPPDSNEAEDEGSAVGGAPRMPNLRATASARWVDGTVRVQVRVIAARPQLVRQGFLVRIAIPSLGERKDVMVRLRGDRVRTKVIRLETPSSAIGRRVAVKVDPTGRVLEARERDNGAGARVRR
jgi:hypothetical protein